MTEKGESQDTPFTIGCAHCGQLVGTISRPPRQEKMKGLPKHDCPVLKKTL